MKVARFTLRGRDGAPRWGRVSEGGVEEIGEPFAGELKPTGATFALDEIELDVPARPSKILAVARNYREHAAEQSAPAPTEPMTFLKPPSALQRHEGPIRLPPGVGRVDYEGELVIVIGTRGRNLSRDEARRAVWGVTCGNDVSARRLQKQDLQWTRAKGFDTFACVGPVIAVGLDPADLLLTTRVNGEVRQRGRTSEMIFDPLTLVMNCSQAMTLEPGDLLYTGTPAGVGELHAGDVVEVELEGVGVLRNRVVAD